MKKWVSKCGRVTLYCGDCLEILPTLGNVDAVVTDPPYGVGFTGTVTRHSVKTGNTYNLFDDTPENVEKVCVPVIKICIKIARNVTITPGIKNQRLYPHPQGEGVIWYPSGANRGPWGFITHQPLYYYGKCPYLSTGQGSRPTGFSTTEPAEKNGHPCPKPIGQMKWIVLRSSLLNETILDPFMGSGTTGVAAIQLDRCFIGIEIDPDYFQIAKDRIMAALAQPKLFKEPEPKPKQKKLIDLLNT